MKEALHMGLPVINIDETDKLSKAMEAGSPFYIANKNKKLLVSDPEMRAAEAELIAALEAAENCHTYYTLEETWEHVNKVLHDKV